MVMTHASFPCPVENEMRCADASTREWRAPVAPRAGGREEMICLKASSTAFAKEGAGSMEAKPVL